jgi:hypothetical protein
MVLIGKWPMHVGLVGTMKANSRSAQPSFGVKGLSAVRQFGTFAGSVFSHN